MPLARVTFFFLSFFLTHSVAWLVLWYLMGLASLVWNSWNSYGTLEVLLSSLLESGRFAIDGVLEGPVACERRVNPAILRKSNLKETSKFYFICPAPNFGNSLVCFHWCENKCNTTETIKG